MDLPPVVPFEQKGRSATRCEDCTECTYCGRPLHVKHEHDHFPVPARHGGTMVMPACRDCHSLKDRLPFDAWPANALTEALLGIYGELGTPAARVLVAKLMMDTADLRAQRDAYQAQLREHGIEPASVPSPPLPTLTRNAA